MKKIITELQKISMNRDVDSPKEVKVKLIKFGVLEFSCLLAFIVIVSNLSKNNNLFGSIILLLGAHLVFSFMVMSGTIIIGKKNRPKIILVFIFIFTWVMAAFNNIPEMAITLLKIEAIPESIQSIFIVSLYMIISLTTEYAVDRAQSLIDLGDGVEDAEQLADLISQNKKLEEQNKNLMNKVRELEK